MRKRKNELMMRILVALCVSFLVAAVVLIVSIIHVAQKNAEERYERDTQTTVNVFSQNINYYIISSVNAVKAVYGNNQLLSLLEKRMDRFPNQSERDSILNYMKTVHYACSSAEQIYVSCPNLHQSYVYNPSIMNMTYENVQLAEETVPQFNSFMDVVIEPTHLRSSYGHQNTYSRQRQNDYVITIWVPIYNLPENTEIIACVAIDMPVDFLMNNTQIVSREGEVVMLISKEGKVIASNDLSLLDRSVSDIPKAGKMMELPGRKGMIIENTMCLAYDVTLQYDTWRLLKLVPMVHIHDSTWKMMLFLLLLFFALLGLILLFNTSNIAAHLSPLRTVTEYMDKLTREQSWDRAVPMTETIGYSKKDEIADLIASFDRMMAEIESYRIRQYELRLANDRATYRMLQAQINPHFIYNAIQCFATHALKQKDMEQYRMLSDFGQMMHYAMVLNPSMVSLKQELEYVERYVNIQKMRFRSSEPVEYDVAPDTLKLPVPKMCIQPLVENSIHHGGLFRESGSRLRISACSRDGYLWITVKDNGQAVSQEKKKEIQEDLDRLKQYVKERTRQETIREVEEEQGHATIGLANVYYRMLLSFTDARMEVNANDWGGTTVGLYVSLSRQGGMEGMRSYESADRG